MRKYVYRSNVPSLGQSFDYHNLNGERVGVWCVRNIYFQGFMIYVFNVWISAYFIIFCFILF